MHLRLLSLHGISRLAVEERGKKASRSTREQSHGHPELPARLCKVFKKSRLTVVPAKKLKLLIAEEEGAGGYLVATVRFFHALLYQPCCALHLQLGSSSQALRTSVFASSGETLGSPFCDLPPASHPRGHSTELGACRYTLGKGAVSSDHNLLPFQLPPPSFQFYSGTSFGS